MSSSACSIWMLVAQCDLDLSCLASWTLSVCTFTHYVHASTLGTPAAAVQTVAELVQALQQAIECARISLAG